MDEERWRRIEQLYHSALEVEESQRSAFLEETCGGDESLRREVESLLAGQKQGRELPEVSGAGNCRAGPGGRAGPAGSPQPR